MTNSNRKRKQVVLACVACRQSKTACDEERPCKRCVSKGIGHSCVDAPKKKRMTKKEKLLALSLNPPTPKIAKNKRKPKKTQTKPKTKEVQSEELHPHPHSHPHPHPHPHHSYHYSQHQHSHPHPSPYVHSHPYHPPESQPQIMDHFQNISAERLLDVCLSDGVFLEPMPTNTYIDNENQRSYVGQNDPSSHDFLSFPTVSEPESFEPFIEHQNISGAHTTGTSTDLLSSFLNNTPSVESLVHNLANEYDMYVHCQLVE